MVAFLRNGVTVIVVFFILSLSMSIFSPIINNTLSDLVDIAIYDNAVQEGNNGPQTSYYASLYSAKTLIVNMFNLSPFAISITLLVWYVLSALRREESDYYV